MSASNHSSPAPRDGVPCLPILPLACALLLACGPLAVVTARVASAQDFGDHTSATLTGKAWKALGDGQPDGALVYTAKCRELYAGEAEKQQKSLADFAAAEKAHDYWALNDVGTCLFIEGQVHEKAGRTKEAVAAYKSLADNYGFCQCWDTKGWFWRPAEAAAARVKELAFDAKLD